MFQIWRRGVRWVIQVIASTVTLLDVKNDFSSNYITREVISINTESDGLSLTISLLRTTRTRRMSLLSFINDWKRLDIKCVENSDRQMPNWGYGVRRCKDIKWTYPEKSQKHSMRWLMSRVKLYNVKHLIRYGRNWSLPQTIITSAVRRLCMEEWRRPIRPDHLWRRISARSSVTTYDLWFPMTKRFSVQFIKFVSEQSRIF